MSEFLENLKKAADNGEFNSEAAKKILEISELADTKIKGENIVEELEKLKEAVEKRAQEATPAKTLSEDEVLEVNSTYEKKMAAIKKTDAINAQLATLIEIEDMVKASIEDMFSFTDELEAKFEKELEAEDPMLGDLSLKIEELKSKYKSIIN